MKLRHMVGFQLWLGITGLSLLLIASVWIWQELRDELDRVAILLDLRDDTRELQLALDYGMLIDGSPRLLESIGEHASELQYRLRESGVPGSAAPERHLEEIIFIAGMFTDTGLQSDATLAGQFRIHQNGLTDTLDQMLRDSHESLLNTSLRSAALFLGTALLFALVMVLVSARINQRLHDPLQRIEQAIRQLASGHHDTRINMDSQDELGALSRTVDEMAGQRQQYEKELASREREMAQMQRLESLGQLTGGVAHDFNNLLQVITGNVELLSEQLADRPDLQALAKTTEQAAERGSALTNNLLSYARRQPLDPSPTDINTVISESRLLLERSLGSRIHLSVQLTKALPDAMIDRSQLESALLNLCINARDAMHGKGAIRVQTSQIDASSLPEPVDEEAPDTFLALSVQDEGPGIDPDAIDRVFDPFFSTKGPGHSGLGLSMVFGFVTQSRGQIRMESTGRGCRFTLFLPGA